MTAFSLGARLYRGANSSLAVSLPQSFCPMGKNPAPSSEGAEAAAAAEHRFSLAEHRVAENVLKTLAANLTQGSQERSQSPLCAAPLSTLHTSNSYKVFVKEVYIWMKEMK